MRYPRSMLSTLRESSVRSTIAFLYCSTRSLPSDITTDSRVSLTLSSTGGELISVDSTVWPLFHYQLDKVSYDEKSTTAYRNANQIFADTIAQDLKDGDLVWVQDYHLMLLPQMLRQQAQKKQLNIRLGFFLHTPFPGEDFFTTLPSRTEVLEGILAADVIGFHTDEYRRHFLEACHEVL